MNSDMESAIVTGSPPPYPQRTHKPRLQSPSLSRFARILLISALVAAGMYILTVIIVVLGCSNTGLEGAYHMQFDFSHFDTGGKQLGIDEIYRVGTGGYCYGNWQNGKVVIEGCRTSRAPFVFDLQSIFDDATEDSFIEGIAIPTQVQAQQSYFRRRVRASFALWMVGFAGVAVILSGVGAVILFGGSIVPTVWLIMGVVLYICGSIGGITTLSAYSKYAKVVNLEKGVFPLITSRGKAGTFLCVWNYVIWLVLLVCTQLGLYGNCLPSSFFSTERTH